MLISGQRATMHEVKLMLDDESYQVLSDFLKRVDYDTLEAFYDNYTSTPKKYAAPLTQVLHSLNTIMMTGQYANHEDK